VLVATLPRVRMLWKPPAALPPLIPIAYYAGLGDAAAPEVWMSADHPELVSPRLSRLTDEIPLFAELLLASVDLPAAGLPPLGLAELPAERRRLAASALAGRVAVVTRYTAYPAVGDDEFARRAFAFNVLRRAAPELDTIPAGDPQRESWILRFVLDTAERQPRESAVRAAYEAARAADGSNGRSTARRAFAAPYLAQVAALLKP
jgi:hypothetical protein